MAWGPQGAGFDLQAFLLAAMIPPDQEAVLNSSQAWRPADLGDELQSASRVQEPPATAQQQHGEQVAPAAPGAAPLHPLQLFESLDAAAGPSALQDERRKQPDTSPQQQLEQQQQAVSEAHRQAVALVGSLADSPVSAASKPLPLPPTGLYTLLGDAEQEKQQQQPTPSHADVQPEAAAAAAAEPSAMEEEVAAAVIVAAAQQPAADTKDPMEVEAAAAVDEPMIELALEQQEVIEPAGAATEPATAAGPPAATPVTQQPEEDEEWADAAAALVLPGSQGGDDFQDAQEELPLVAADAGAENVPVAAAVAASSQAWAVALLTQSSLSPDDFAIATQLPDSQLAAGGEGVAAGAAPGSSRAAWEQQQQEQQAAAELDNVQAPPAPLQQQSHHGVEVEESHSLQGSVAQQGSMGGRGDSVDSQGAGTRRLSGTWLLGSLGSLTQAFKRNASQAKQAPAPGAFMTLAPAQLSPHQPSQLQGLSQQQLLAQQKQQAAVLRRTTGSGKGNAAAMAAGEQFAAAAAMAPGPDEPSAPSSAAAVEAVPAAPEAEAAVQAVAAPLEASAANAAPQSPSLPGAALGLFSGESVGNEAAAANAGAPAHIGISARAAKPAGTPKVRPIGVGGHEAARTPQAVRQQQQQLQQQERRLSGGFLDILACISSPQPPSLLASPGARLSPAAPAAFSPAGMVAAPAAVLAKEEPDSPAMAAEVPIEAPIRAEEGPDDVPEQGGDMNMVEQAAEEGAGLPAASEDKQTAVGVTSSRPPGGGKAGGGNIPPTQAIALTPFPEEVQGEDEEMAAAPVEVDNGAAAVAAVEEQMARQAEAVPEAAEEAAPQREVQQLGAKAAAGRSPRLAEEADEQQVAAAVPAAAADVASVAEGSPFDTLPTPLPPPSQWPESQLSERVPPTPAADTQPHEPSQEAAADAAADAVVAAEAPQQQPTARSAADGGLEQQQHDPPLEAAKPAPAAAAAPTPGAAAAASQELPGQQAAMAVVPVLEAQRPVVLALEQHKLVEAMVGADPDEVTALLAAEEQADEGRGGAAGGGLGTAATLAAAVAAAAAKAAVGPVLFAQHQHEQQAGAGGSRGSGGFSFPALAAGCGGSRGVRSNKLAGARRSAAAASGDFGSMLEATAEADVLELLQSSRRQRGEQPAPAQQQQRRQLGLHHLSEWEEQEEQELAAAQALLLAAEAEAAANAEATSHAAQVPASHAEAGAAQAVETGLPSCHTIAGTPTAAAAHQCPARAQHGFLRLKLMASSTSEAGTAATLPAHTTDAAMQHPSMAGGRKSANTDTQGLPLRVCGTAVVQTSPGLGRATVAVQVPPPPPATRNVKVQVNMVPAQCKAAVSAVQMGSPQLAANALPPAAPAHATAAAAAEAPAPPGHPAVSNGDSSGGERPSGAGAGVSPGRFAPRGRALAVRAVQEWTEDGMALVHLPPGLKPTQVEADREGAAAAQQRLAEAIRHEWEQRLKQELAAMVLDEWRLQEAEAAQLRQQREEAATRRRRGRHQEKQGEQPHQLGKPGGNARRHMAPAAQSAAQPAAQARAAPSAGRPAPAPAVGGHKRARSLGGAPAQPKQCSTVMLAAQQKLRAAQLARQQPQQQPPVQQALPPPMQQQAQAQLLQPQAKRRRTAPVPAPAQRLHFSAPPSAQRLAPLMRLSLSPTVAGVRPACYPDCEQRHAAGGWRPSGPPMPLPAGLRVPQDGGGPVAGQLATCMAPPAYQLAGHHTPRAANLIRALPQHRQEAAVVELTPQQVQQLPTRPNMRASSICNPFKSR